MRQTLINLLLLLMLLLPLCLTAQTERFYTVNAELPNSLITALAQDSIGNIWIGTENGLCKYDGAKFTHYYNNRNDEGSLLSSHISDIYVTAQGRVLVGSSVGLQVYDPAYNRFEKIKLLYNGTDTIPVHVSCIEATPKGDLLVGSLGCGVFRVDKVLKQGYPALDGHGQDVFVANMAVTNDGNIWFGLAREGAMRGIWDTDRHLELIPIPGTGDWNVETILTDNKGDAYYCTQYGLHKVSRKDLTHRLLLRHDNKKILCAQRVSDNIILLGIHGSGIMAYDIREEAVTELPYNTGRTDITDSDVRALLIDASGNLWAGLYQRGVFACQSQSSQFGYIGSENSLTHGTPPRAVMALYPDADGTLWVVPDNDGLYAIISKTQVRHYPQAANGLPPMITCVYKDSAGTVWIGSIDLGLARIDQVSGRASYVAGFSGMSVFDIVEDDEHHLWIATMGKGLYRTDLNGNIEYKAPYTDQRHYTTGSDLLNNSWINSLTLSDDGKKLFINTCFGVGCYDKEAKSYVSEFGENRILAGEMCYDSYHDPEGYLWVTTSNGVYRWHHDESDIMHYDTNDGLCNNTVVGVVPDNDGNIWFATYYGLSKFDRKTGCFTNYYAQDGIQGNEFSLRSMARGNDGTIYAGGLNGITSFKTVNLATKVPRVRIADIYHNDKQVNYGSESKARPIIRQSEDGRLTYQFDVSDSSIGVELTTDQFNNYNINYQYSVDSGEWQTLQRGANKVYFSNLSPGHHIIAFKALSYDTESSPETLDIYIHPHWYLTWLMKLIYCLLGVVLMYIIYKVIKHKRQMEAQLEEQRKREAFNVSTMQFLVNIAHEIRTPISLITNPIDRLAEVHTDPESRHLFGIIRTNTNRMMLLANQLLDVRKIDHNQMKLNRQPVEIVEYIRRTMSMFDDLAATKHINLRLDATSDRVYADIDPYQFDKVIVNLLSNSFKYTKAGGNITIIVEVQGCTLRIIVKDDGTGIPPESIDHIFERFYQASTKGSFKNLGSGVGLHLTQLLVTMHSGTIKGINNTDGHGVSFIIEMPALTDVDADKLALRQAYEPAETDADHIVMPIVDECDYDLESKNLKSRSTIVIVEDNADIRQYLHEQLQSAYNIMSYDNVKEAWDSIVSNKPDLLITDVVLPDDNGVSLIKLVRQNIHTNDLPIIVLSAKHAEEDIMECIDNGADFYMTKPFKIKVLRSYIESLLSQRRRLKVIYNGKQIDEKVTTDSSDIKTPDDVLMERLSKALNANIGNPDYTIADMASDVCMSRVHLNRKLKQLTNQSPSTYLRNMRLAKAAEMLRDNPGISVGDVATAVGMTSFSHFSHAFKQLYGCSPSEYAER